jgi:hypothetical protein
MKLLKFIFPLVLISYNTFATMIEGTATLGGTVIYTEKHNATINAKGMYDNLQSEYFDKSNKKIATIKSDFAASAITPNYRFEDLRKNTTEVVNLDASKKNIIIERTEKGISYKSKLDLESNSVAGQGFHNFLIQNFDKLVKSGGEVFFVNTSKVDQFKFDIEVQSKEANKVCFKVVPTNVIYRTFIPPMILCYDSTTKRVISFEGLSNIEGPNGKLEKVIITYIYLK